MYWVPGCLLSILQSSHVTQQILWDKYSHFTHEKQTFRSSFAQGQTSLIDTNLIRTQFWVQKWAPNLVDDALSTRVSGLEGAWEI